MTQKERPLIEHMCMQMGELSATVTAMIDATRAWREEHTRQHAELLSGLKLVQKRVDDLERSRDVGRGVLSVVRIIWSVIVLLAGAAVGYFLSGR